MSTEDPESTEDFGLDEMLSGPGAMLRTARRRKSMSVDEAAAQLHLPPQSITRLEEDDYGTLGGTVFTQGYLRNYARIVDVPADQVLAAFRRTRPVEENSLRLSRPRTAIKTEQVNSSHLSVRIITWLIVIGLLVLLVVWLRGLDLSSLPGIGAFTETGAQQESDHGKDDAIRYLDLGSAAAPPGNQASPDPKPEPDAVPGGSEPPIETDPESGDAETPDAETGQGEESPVAQATPEGPPEPDATPAKQVDAEAAEVSQRPAGTGDAAETDGETPDEAASAEGPPGPVPELAALATTSEQGVWIRFTAPCWVDIRDSKGEVLL
ncbi:MAG: helix-turn-helix domain-containing protein, partial [Pseudomonadota bacterium]